MRKTIVFASGLLLGLCLTASVRTARADSFTEVFNGFTFNDGETGEVFGHLTLDTNLLPPLTRRYNSIPNPYSSWSLTWIKTNGTVVNFDTLR